MVKKILSIDEKAEIDHKNMIENRKNKSNEEVLKLYQKDFLKDKAKTTIENHTRFLKKYMKLIKGKKFAEVNEQQIKDFLNPYSDGSRKYILSVLQGFYRWEYSLTSRDKLPIFIRSIKRPKVKIDRLAYDKKKISFDEYNRLIGECTKSMHRAIVETFYFTGCRVSELLSMLKEDVSYKDGITTIGVSDSKTETRYIPVDERLNHLISWIQDNNDYPNDSNVWIYKHHNNRKTLMLRRSVGSLLNRLSKRAKLNKNISPHSFRHTAISNDLDRGMPESHIKTKYGLTKDSSMLKAYDRNGLPELNKYIKDHQSDKKPEMYETLKQKNQKMKDNYEIRIKKLEELIKLQEEKVDERVESRIDKFLKETIPKN